MRSDSGDLASEDIAAQTSADAARLAISADEGCKSAPNVGPPPPFLVAAVGASAGGLEAFSRLMQRMPSDAPLALVIVQHLSRDKQSLLPEILARRTALAVIEAQDEMKIESGHAYVIPAATYMTVTDGHLRIRPRPAGPSGAQVNVLFRSIAEHYGDKAVGVVLSGGATDGATGLRQIKAVGGITIAQQPDDAQIDGMPRAAIAAGAADMVLSVDEIGEELLRLAALPLYGAEKHDDDATEPTADKELYASIFSLLRRGTGVDFSGYKRPTIARRIARRMALRRVQTLAAYLDILSGNNTEVETLAEDVLIHVTSFFREPDSFLALTRSVIPNLLRERGDSPLRIWVPGCASGEEVYSLAISLFEVLADESELVPLQIFGTDVSKASVERARAGVYAQAIAAEVSPERLRRFFSKTDGHYQISKAIRERCVFARQDLTRDPPFSRLDMVMCRNTLIYLGQPVQRRVIAMIHYSLKPNGFLMLGRAETPGSGGDLFSVFDKRTKIYRKKPGASPPEFDFRAAPFEARDPNPVRETRVGAPPRVARPWDVQAEANRFLLERYAPPGIVVDAAFQIVSTRGPTAPFLELPSGPPSFDALKMVRDDLLPDLRSALHEARGTHSVVRKENVGTLASQGALVTLEVAPLGTPEALHYLVSFESPSTRESAAPDLPAAHAEPGNAADAINAKLRRELAVTREELHANINDLAAANEELQSANEEILSSNEELQSTNEELDTAKEELQSTNEELSTVNEELHGRNDELSLSNSDLSNLLASVQIPIVMIARDLTIRRFTPAAQRLLNLIPSDVGRPIRHIKPNIALLDLEKPAAEVIETMAPFEREVEDDAGKTYLLRIRPYKSVENRVDGAVLALLEISATKDALSVARQTAEALVSRVPDPILLLDSELKVTGANPAFCTAFALELEAVEGQHVYELGRGQWNIPALRRLLEHVLLAKEDFEGFVIEHEFARVGKRRLLLDGQRIQSGRSGAGVILLAIRVEEPHVN